MRVLSSYRERCLMSVQSLLAGLMPPNESENPLPIEWQPVAVKALPADTDYVGNFYKKIKNKNHRTFCSIKINIPSADALSGTCTVSKIR